MQRKTVGLKTEQKETVIDEQKEEWEKGNFVVCIVFVKEEKKCL